jgi:hypothetical protein
VEHAAQAQLVDEPLGLGLVVARQVRELQAPADHRPEELLAAHCTADDQVPGIVAVLVQPGRCLDELAEALRRVDEAEVRDDRPVGRKPERALRGRGIAGVERSRSTEPGTAEPTANTSRRRG